MFDRHYYLGVDLGTSAMKMALIDGHKRMVAQRTLDYQIDQPCPGWREIEPARWFDCMAEGMEALFREFDPRCVDAIGVTGQMHTTVLLDKAGASVRPAIMWDDTRTRELAPVLRDMLERREDSRYLARTISTGSPAANLFWLKKEEPERFARLARFLIAPDYLVYRLTGEFGTDYCEASTSCLYDISLRRWSPFFQELLGLDDGVYPPVRGSAVPAGTVTGEIARRFGLRQDVPVLTGTGDNPATALAVGCLGDGKPVISLGTSGVLMMQKARADLDAKGKIILYSKDGKEFSYLVQGVLQANGSTFDWLIRTVLNSDDYGLVDQMLQNRPYQRNDLLFFPHLLGEKTLFSDPDVRGALLGVSTMTTREDMAEAVLEGLCFGYRELAEEMRLDLKVAGGVRCVGGGARSVAWAQTLANVLGVPVEQMDGVASPGFGIALLAASIRGGTGGMAGDAMKVKAVFTPAGEAARDADRKYEMYKRIYQALKTVYAR